MIPYEFKPGECPVFKRTLEKHECPCGGVTTTCGGCGGDYHEDPEEKAKCYLEK